jgi:hypothetical protein
MTAGEVRLGGLEAKGPVVPTNDGTEWASWGRNYQTNPILIKPVWKTVKRKAKNEANLAHERGGRWTQNGWFFGVLQWHFTQGAS